MIVTTMFWKPSEEEAIMIAKCQPRSTHGPQFGKANWLSILLCIKLKL